MDAEGAVPAALVDFHMFAASQLATTMEASSKNFLFDCLAFVAFMADLPGSPAFLPTCAREDFRNVLESRN
jgi:hypothetical protein